MAKRVNKKEKLFNLELYVQTLEERIQRLEKNDKRYSENISNIVVDVRNLENKFDTLEFKVYEDSNDADRMSDEIKTQRENLEALEKKVCEISIKAKDTDIKNSIVNYLISTDFKGSVKHKRLISRLKKEVKDALKANSFEELRREILNGDRSLDDLIDYKHILEKHEADQKVVDYCNKED